MTEIPDGLSVTRELVFGGNLRARWYNQGNGLIYAEVGQAQLSPGGPPAERCTLSYLTLDQAADGNQTPYVVQSLGPTLLVASAQGIGLVDTETNREEEWIPHGAQGPRLDDDRIGEMWRFMSPTTQAAVFALHAGERVQGPAEIESFRNRHCLTDPGQARARPETGAYSMLSIPAGDGPGTVEEQLFRAGWDTERLTSSWAPRGDGYCRTSNVRLVASASTGKTPGVRHTLASWTPMAELTVTPETDGLFGDHPANRAELKDPNRPALNSTVQYSFQLGLPEDTPIPTNCVVAQWHQVPNHFPPLAIRLRTGENGERHLRIISKSPDPDDPEQVVTQSSAVVPLGPIVRVSESFTHVTVDAQIHWSADSDGLILIRVWNDAGVQIGRFLQPGKNALENCGGEPASAPGFKAGIYDSEGLKQGKIRVRFGAYARARLD